MRVEVVAAVIERNGKFLICRRPDHKRHGGLWEFPGGKLEPGESLLDGARRELTEELGLSVTNVGAVRLTVVDPGSVFAVNFVDVVADGTPQPSEHSDVKWLSVQDLAELDLAPTDQVFVQHLQAEAHRPG